MNSVLLSPARNPYGKQPENAYFHVLLRPSVAGEVALAVNIDGTGLRKEHAQSQAIKGGELNHVCFIIRAGKLSTRFIDDHPELVDRAKRFAGDTSPFDYGPDPRHIAAAAAAVAVVVQKH